MWSNRENCKDWAPTIQQHLPKALDFIVVYVFRWPCYQIQVNTPVDVWSNHACQVALFFPSISTACSSRSDRSCPASELLAQVGGSVNTRSSPASRKCTPRQLREHVNQQAASCPRSANTSWWSCCHWILGKECTLTPSSRSESELLDLHGPRGPRPTFQETAEG